MRFPENFLFGVATSAHQIEGGIQTNDWWEWERVPGRIYQNHNTERACEHWTRFSEDIDLMRDMGIHSYRFSIEWARVEPQEGVIDRDALERYVRIADLCRRSGIEPCVTLFHFTLPKWVADRGGWSGWPDVVPAFQRFSQIVSAAVPSTLWVTHNEPMVYLFMAYLEGVWPPRDRGIPAMVRAGRRMILAHYAAAHSIKSSLPDARIGLAQHVRVFDPADAGSPWDRWAARSLSYMFNWSMLECVEQGRFLVPFGVGEAIPGRRLPQDYVGLNYYTRDHVRFGLNSKEMFGTRFTPDHVPKNELGWEIYPEGLYRLLKRARRFQKPIYVLENGVCDSEDRLRSGFISDHLLALGRAIAEGIPVRGYYHWSLLDNFEWQGGFAPRFGLVHVDYESQKRTPRDSARHYARVCRSRSVGRESS
jgi:beta-glucosidase